MKENEMNFKNFAMDFEDLKREIEYYIYNEIDINNFDISEYLIFLKKFYDMEDGYYHNKYYDNRFSKNYQYIENLNSELRKILDL